MKQLIPILTITGSDSTGGAGVQGDVKTITALGGYALTVLTSVTVQNTLGIDSVYNLPTSVVAGQLHAVMSDVRPVAVKVGMIGSAEAVKVVAEEMPSMAHVVCTPGLESSYGKPLVSADVVRALCEHLFPLTDVLVVKCSEAEMLLNSRIRSMQEMGAAARQLRTLGAKAVCVFGGRSVGGVMTNALATDEGLRYFTLSEIDIRKTHGFGSTLSSAIATYLASGHNIVAAVNSAHEYIRSLVLYSLNSSKEHTSKMLLNNEGLRVSDRQTEIYNSFVHHVTVHHRTQREVQFYSSLLCVTPRYLSEVVRKVSGKNPKQLISDILIDEAERELLCTKKSVQAISSDFGFSSQAQFSKFFRKAKGVPPSDLRKRNE